MRELFKFKWNERTDNPDGSYTIETVIGAGWAYLAVVLLVVILCLYISASDCPCRKGVA